MKHIFAIGDIHGCMEKLDALMKVIMEKIDFEHDTLVFLGDYIDRGPNSFEVVDYLIRLKKQFAKSIVFLKGNHEEMLEKYLDGLDREMYLTNGGLQTLESYIENETASSRSPIPPDHMNFFSSLKLFYETDQYIFVHAGLKPRIPLFQQSHEDLLWMRTEFIESKYNFGKLVIFGHTPFLSPMIQPNKIGIDTGAVYGYRLTCVKLPQVEFYTA